MNWLKIGLCTLIGFLVICVVILSGCSTESPQTQYSTSAVSSGTTNAYNLIVVNNASIANYTIIPETYGSEMTYDGTFSGTHNCTTGTGWYIENNYAKHNGSTGGYLTCNLSSALEQNAVYRVYFGLENVSTRGVLYVYSGSGTSNTNVVDYWVDATSTMNNQTYTMYGYTLRTPGTSATTNRIFQIYSTGTFQLDNLSVVKVNGGTITEGNLTIGQGYIKQGNSLIKIYNYADKIHLDGVCIGPTCEYTTYSEDFNVPDGGRIGVATISGSGIVHAGCGTNYMTEGCTANVNNNRTQTYYNKNSTILYAPSSGGNDNYSRIYPAWRMMENVSNVYQDVWGIDANYTLVSKGGIGITNNSITTPGISGNLSIGTCWINYYRGVPTSSNCTAY